MKKHMKPWRKLLRSVAGESGATFIEYAMLAGLVAIVVAIAAAVFGKRIKEMFMDTAGQAKTIGDQVKDAKIEGAFK